MASASGKRRAPGPRLQPILDSVLGDKGNARHGADQLVASYPQLGRVASTTWVEEQLSELAARFARNEVDRANAMELLEHLTGAPGRATNWTVIVGLRSPLPARVPKELWKSLHGAKLLRCLPKSCGDTTAILSAADQGVWEGSPRFLQLTVHAVDPQKALEKAVALADSVVGTLRVAIRRSWPFLLEPPVVEVADEAGWLRPPSDRSWRRVVRTHSRPLPTTEASTGWAVSPTALRVMNMIVAEENGIECGSSLQSRLVGTFHLLSEAERVRESVIRLTRYVCALEHLTTFDSFGKSNIALALALRTAVLTCGTIRLDVLGRAVGEAVERVDAARQVMSSIRKEVYEFRSRLVHSWAPAFAASPKLPDIADLSQELAVAALDSAMCISDDYHLVEENDLVKFLDAVLTSVLVLGCTSVGLGEVGLYAAGQALRGPSRLAESDELAYLKSRGLAGVTPSAGLGLTPAGLTLATAASELLAGRLEAVGAIIRGERRPL